MKRKTACWHLCLCVMMMFSASCETKRVMLMPLPISSHAVMHLTLAEALTAKGHEVWVVLSTDIVRKGYHDLKGVHIIEYTTSISMQDDIVLPLFLKPYFEGREPEIENHIQLMWQLNDEIMTNQSLFQTMRDVKPDLFMCDDGDHSRIYLIFAYRMGIPFAGLHFAQDPFFRRIPFSPAVDPIEFLPLGQHMTFAERLNNFLSYVSLYMGHPLCPENAVELYAPEMPYIPMTMLGAKAEVYLSENDHFLDYPRPSLPNTKVIGGIAASPAKPLSADLQEFMDNAKHGVVIVSFGSLVLDLPEGAFSKLLSALESVPMKVVFRANRTSPDPGRILIMPWIPQNDLLAHPNSKVLVTHCGASSQAQALYHAVPMLSIPLFYDQFYNAERVRQKGFGLTLDLRTAEVSDIVRALMTLWKSSAYRDAIARASRLFRDQMGVPAERGAYWLDHVMKYGGGYMRSAGQEIPLYQFLLLDVVFFIVAALILCLCLMSAALWCFWGKCFQRKSKAD
ncbi:UDP-glucuronosyltransferase 2B10-like [Pomacea canaliculata]|uniref:UDP-glucuronosyltransferase 2B10-like n=1 Tax=Pomacea canaliculata TaxID=400727 RepID=UPI000D73D7F9|nr:UDP-glucuronosyltransferase 2B10-like [Pomacea canaliculata]